MRQILVDQPRRRAARKLGGDARRVELAEGIAYVEPPAADVLALDEAIQALQHQEPPLAELVMLRYYSGLSVEETAAVLGLSPSTVKRDWRRARAWLSRHLGRQGEG
jgi:RNA polymerase sigma factor (TIGR02999 family)